MLSFATSLLLGLTSAEKEFKYSGPIDVEEEANEYHVVHPVVTRGQHQDSDHHTRMPARGSETPDHATDFHFEFSAFGQSFTMKMKKTHDLFSADFKHLTWGEDGSVTEDATLPENCYYQGVAHGEAESWATGETCKNGFDGIIRAHGNKYVMRPLDQHPKLHNRIKDTLPKKAGMTAHVIYKVKDLKEQPASGCGHGHDILAEPETRDASFSSDDEYSSGRSLLQWSRVSCGNRGMTASSCASCSACAGDCYRRNDGQCRNFNDDFGGSSPVYSPTWSPPVWSPPTWSPPVYSPPTRSPPSAPRPTPFPNSPSPPTSSGGPFTGSGTPVELHWVNDRAMTRNQGSSIQSFTLKSFNDVKANYNRLGLGINIVLTHISSWTSDQVSMGRDIYDSLSAFQSWSMRQPYKADNYQMVTGTDMNGGIVGLASMYGMCGSKSGGVNEYGRDWAFMVETVTHEMGHNWGASHDSSGNSCDPRKYMMASHSCSSCPPITSWSRCSKSSISSNLNKLKNKPGGCFSNRPATVLARDTLPECGNGLVEAGEECDLGGANGHSPLCSTDCKMVQQGTQCLEGACCDVQTGKFRGAGSLCRSSLGECDLADTCSGTSSECPQDVFKVDGDVCYEAGANGKCYQGGCLSVDDQCAQAFKDYAGTWKSSTFCGSCVSTDPCGKLSCVNVDAENQGCVELSCPEGKTCFVQGQSTQQISAPSSVPMCVDAGSKMAQQQEQQQQLDAISFEILDGTPCGDGRQDLMCMDRKCVQRATIQSKDAGIQCSPAECSMNGKCGQDIGSGIGCVCNPGFMGVKCEIEVQCSAMCAKLGRETCVADEKCGPCLPGLSTPGRNLDDHSIPCELFDAKITSAENLAKPEDATVADLYDGDIYKSWVHTFTLGEKPSVILQLKEAALVAMYEITSSNAAETSDPATWTLEGSEDGTTWTKLDFQHGVQFISRHQTNRFFLEINPDVKVAFLRLTVESVFNSLSQGDSQLTIEPVIVQDGQVQNVSLTTQIQVPEARPVKLSIAEIKVYAANPELNYIPTKPASVLPVSSASGMVAGVVGVMTTMAALVATA